jgi:adenosylcobinamide-phosphate synthase
MRAPRPGRRLPPSASRPLGAAAGIALDRLLPEPPGAVHPVVLFGFVMTSLERRLHRDRKGAGLVHASAGLAVGLAVGAAVRSTTLATTSAVAGRALGQAANDVGRALDDGDLARARALLPALVGRDPSGLDEGELARAAVESVAENTVDAVVAPALWAAVAGAPGALGYRAVNTLDSMVGHRSERYANYGWASARLDDVVAWVPARLTAALVALVRPRATRPIWSAVRRQAPKHPSPNAGVAEAAFAAALGVRLGGRNRYGDRTEERVALGDGRAAQPSDIDAAVRLSRDVSAALAALLTVAGGLRWWWTR